MGDDAKIVLIIVGCIALAAFVYAVEAGYLELPQFNQTIENVIDSSIAFNQKVEPELRTQFAVNPTKQVRMFISLKDNESIKELQSKGIKIIRKGKYVNYAVVEGNYKDLQKIVSIRGVNKVYDDKKVRILDFDFKGLDINKLPVKPAIVSGGWNLQAIKADTAQNNNFTGSNAVVAVIDTGVNHHLPDLDDGYLEGWDFAENDSEPDDEFDHGTLVASIIAGEGDNIYKGVAPDAHYYALKALNDEGWGNMSDVIAAMEWVLDKINEGEKIDVVSMSYGSDTPTVEEQQICDLLYSKGVILVAASGNEGYTTSLYPAGYDSVISVAANDVSSNVAAFSNGGALVSAPGVQVPALSTDGTIKYVDGTSFATPHVSGALLLVESRKDLTPQQAFNLLSISTNAINDPADKVQHGQIDCIKMVNNALNLNLSDYRSIWDYLKEPYVQILMGLFILAGMKIFVWKRSEA
ncbi:hypothetical protein DRO97_01970 [Archaeoglobales archaeon]|nr:MAG: hypothetical protein DRO97_01970 [Archaeoglobales archaeon]